MSFDYKEGKGIKTYVQYVNDAALFGGSPLKFHPVISFESPDGQMIAKQTHHIYEMTPAAVKKFAIGIFKDEVKLSNQWLPCALNKENWKQDSKGTEVNIDYLKNSPNVSGRKQVKVKFKK